MKTSFLFSFVFILTSSSFSQNYSFKKGKINSNDVTIAKYDGKGGVFKNLKLKISSLDEKPLMNIEVFNHDFANPLLDRDKTWMVINIPASPERSIACKLGSDITEKGVLAVLFKDGTSTIIKDNSINQDELEKFINQNKYDYVADSLAVTKWEEENKKRIAQLVSRDMKGRIELKLIETKTIDGITKLQVFDILQSETLIGRLEKKITNGIGTDFDYYVWLKTEPYEFEGKKYEYSPVAFFKRASADFDNKVVLMKGKNIVKFKTPGSLMSSAEYSFVNFLIGSGCL